MASTLMTMGAHVPAGLASSSALQRLRAAVAPLPAAISDWIYLECRLGETDGAVDAVIEIEEPGRAILAGECRGAVLPPAFLAHPAWRGVGDLCRAWGDRTSTLHDCIDHIWLELDVPVRRTMESMPVPGVFVCFGELPTATFSADSWHRQSLLALEVLRGSPPTGPFTACLDRCLQALPPGAYVPYIGCMLGRPRSPVRLCIVGISEDGLTAYLDAVGWPGDTAQIRDLTSGISATRTSHAVPGCGMVHLDVGHTVGPCLGLEYRFDRATQYRGEAPEQDFLAGLQRRRLCHPAKRQALGEWFGYSYESFSHHLWRSLVVRRLNHVKVTSSNGQVEAKAYVLFCSQPHQEGRRPLRRPAARVHMRGAVP